MKQSSFLKFFWNQIGNQFGCLSRIGISIGQIKLFHSNVCKVKLQLSISEKSLRSTFWLTSLLIPFHCPPAFRLTLVARIGTASTYPDLQIQACCHAASRDKHNFKRDYVTSFLNIIKQRHANMCEYVYMCVYNMWGESWISMNISFNGSAKSSKGTSYSLWWC